MQPDHTDQRPSAENDASASVDDLMAAARDVAARGGKRSGGVLWAPSAENDVPEFENEPGYLSPDDCDDCGAYASWCAAEGPCCPTCDHGPTAPIPPGTSAEASGQEDPA